MLNKYMNNISNNALKQQKPVGLINKGYIVYLPMIVSYHICEAIGLPYTMQYTIGRFGNLIFCALLNCFVIYVARRKKLLVATLALMPTLLFQASLYTYDGVIFACMNLGFVLWMNLMDVQIMTKKLHGNADCNCGSIAWHRMYCETCIFSCYDFNGSYIVENDKGQSERIR